MILMEVIIVALLELYIPHKYGIPTTTIYEW
jgi:hypothetical protein